MNWKWSIEWIWTACEQWARVSIFIYVKNKAINVILNAIKIRLRERNGMKNMEVKWKTAESLTVIEVVRKQKKHDFFLVFCSSLKSGTVYMYGSEFGW